MYFYSFVSIGLVTSNARTSEYYCGKMAKRSQPSSDMAAFREVLNKAKNIAILSGAGTSAESGIPTFRGAGGFWRTYQAQDLASPRAFARDPSLVWEFYHYR